MNPAADGQRPLRANGGRSLAAGLLGVRRQEHASVDRDSEYGRFGWVIDPDGNKVEL
jgi:hypothetical protein